MASVCVRNPLLGEALERLGFTPEQGPLPQRGRRRFVAPEGMNNREAKRTLTALIGKATVGVAPRGCGCCHTRVFNFHRLHSR